MTKTYLSNLLDLKTSEIYESNVILGILLYHYSFTIVNKTYALFPLKSTGFHFNTFLLTHSGFVFASRSLMKESVRVTLVQFPAKFH